MFVLTSNLKPCGSLYHHTDQQEDKGLKEPFESHTCIRLVAFAEG